MFFELNDENSIGYKALTDPDLGRSPTSHQTHIGLFDDVLTYLPNHVEIDDAMMIYDNVVETMFVCFDRIETPSGTFRSPKIKTGGQGAVSVVSFIRDKAKLSSENTNWFLFWFGLKSEQPVFFLFNDKSDTYANIVSLGIKLNPMVKARLKKEDRHYNELLNYLQKVVNGSGFDAVRELELIAQTDMPSVPRYRKYDIERARELFQVIGREGEELINRYFFEQRQKNYIQSYKWMNETAESGQPYDFYFEKNDGDIVYLDVKTTRYGFEQKMIFSSQEIKFATNSDFKYHIYRIYGDSNRKFLKICDNAKNLFTSIDGKTSDFESSLCNMATIETVKMAIQPTQDQLSFGNEIILL
ncbi:MAG: DUF3883 domain-containing protein [Bacteroides sp.]|nr:DUF3883 domain-containing protein [Eubacterium sp.]MCM1419282.1 DUF3883 domain-containing protein [Roseburia sp.]MCM1463144.1 DUF3883 domain-containing protein [Bacteroides sp.]